MEDDDSCGQHTRKWGGHGTWFRGENNRKFVANAGDRGGRAHLKTANRWGRNLGGQRVHQQNRRSFQNYEALGTARRDRQTKPHFPGMLWGKPITFRTRVRTVENNQYRTKKIPEYQHELGSGPEQVDTGPTKAPGFAGLRIKKVKKNTQSARA